MSGYGRSERNLKKRNLKDLQDPTAQTKKALSSEAAVQRNKGRSLPKPKRPKPKLQCCDAREPFTPNTGQLRTSALAPRTNNRSPFQQHQRPLHQARAPPWGVRYPRYRGTSLTRTRTPLGPYRRPVPGVSGGSAQGGPRGVGLFS